MNYLLRNKVSRKTGISASSSVVLIFLLFILVVNSVRPTLFHGIIYSAGNPLWHIEDRLSTLFSPWFVLFETKASLVRENKKLEEELSHARLQLQKLEVFEREYPLLGEFISRAAIAHHSIASVLSKPPRISYDILILDRGEEEGVTVGQRVFFENVLLGEITEVFSHMSKAQLFSTEGNEMDVTIGKNHIEGRAYGRGGGNFIVRLPKNVLIEKGDLVTLPGMLATFIGRVEKVETNVTDSFQTILFRFPLSFSSLSYVEIGTGARVIEDDTKNP